MFEQPSDDPAEPTRDPANKAKEKADEFRMHAELFAVFEATRKFDAQIIPALDPNHAREVQRGMAKLEKAKAPDSPLLPETSIVDAATLLKFAGKHDLSTNDYHVHRRPGEVIIVRWIEGDQVETFYERLQAHFNAAMDGFKEDEKQSLEWKQDPETAAYLKALDAIEIKMAERYLREPIQKLNLFVLSTQTADELNINYLADYVMSVPASEIVGGASAPPEDGATEHDLAWFFKLFSLRGMKNGVEQMCFFAFLQKAEDTFDLE